MTNSEQQIIEEVEQALKELPAERITEVLDFVLFLKKRWVEERAEGVTYRDSKKIILHSVPASHLDELTGLVEWGGDAVTDTERLYDDKNI